MSQPSSQPPAPAGPPPSPAAGGAAGIPPDGEEHPVDPAHDLSDSPVHARSPEEYTEEPGSHRRDPEGPALDVGA